MGLLQLILKHLSNYDWWSVNYVTLMNYPVRLWMKLASLKTKMASIVTFKISLKPFNVIKLPSLFGCTFFYQLVNLSIVVTYGSETR